VKYEHARARIMRGVECEEVNEGGDASGSDATVMSDGDRDIEVTAVTLIFHIFCADSPLYRRTHHIVCPPAGSARCPACQGLYLPAVLRSAYAPRGWLCGEILHCR